MGGRVLFALSIAAFPEELPRDTLAAVFEGAASKVREAGGTLAGGHTIRDAEPKYGLAVIGAGHPDRLLRKGGAQPGDTLLLTKRLGTGVLVSGHRQGEDDRRRPRRRRSTRCGRSTAPRRRSSSPNGVAGATDVTGFGLLGHGLEMARASGTRFVFDAAALPALPGALELARGRRRDRRRGPQPALRPARADGRPTASPPSSSSSPTTRRRPAGSSPRSRRIGSRRSRPRSTRPRRRALAGRAGRGGAGGEGVGRPRVTIVALIPGYNEGPRIGEVVRGARRPPAGPRRRRRLARRHRGPGSRSRRDRHRAAAEPGQGRGAAGRVPAGAGRRRRTRS